MSELMSLSVGDLHILDYLAREEIKDPDTQKARSSEVIEDAMRGEV